MVREIEIKYRLSAEAVVPLLDELGKAVPIETSHQVDRVYARDVEAILQPRHGTTVARVRWTAELGQSVLTVKRRRDSDLDRDEIELEVASGDDAAQLLEWLGLQHIVTVAKKRHEARLGEGMALCLDVVEELGSFLEVELLTATLAARASTKEFDPLNALTERHPQIAKMLARTTLRPIFRGYDNLLITRRLEL